MNGSDSPLKEKAAELRRAFDRAFAVAPPAAEAPLEDLLAIRVGPDPYAVRSADISGLFADRKVTFLPSPVGELLGITGVRGAIVPVYDLRALLGYASDEELRWLLLVADRSIGLAFDALDGYLRFPEAARVPDGPALEGRPYTQGVLTVGQTYRPVVDVARVVEAIKRRVTAPIQEE